MQKSGWLTFIVCLIWITLPAQNLITEPVSVPFIKVHYGFHLPAADLNERFGFHFNPGVGLGYKTANHWQLELEGQVLFGNSVKEENIVSHLITDAGSITGSNGAPAQVKTAMRGFSIGLVASKLININTNQPNSGILLQLGSGMLQHKIKYEDVLNAVPQFSKEYVKMFDRLSNGLYINQAIGYQYFSKNKLINYSIVFEIMEGFTALRRSFNFNTTDEETANRLDLTYGIKFTWMLPFYQKAIAKDRYYED